uniref:Nup116p n=1 Tax=Saccharomyces arboricola TaxID=706196 RepID=A0A1L4AAA3_9SACH|nr:Nup116p [Saccharomyces arboricola]
MFGVSRGAFPSATTQPFGSAASSFGAQQQQPQPAASTSTFGLGQQANSSQTPAFGNFGSQTSNSPFGMSGSTPASSAPFGQGQLVANNNASGSMFGGMGNNASLSTGSTSIMPSSTAGTSIKPFTTFEEKDPTTGVTNAFQSITCMPEYRNFSFEELRFQDYQAGRKFGAGQNGSGTTFSNPQATTNTGFGMMGNNASTSTSAGGLFGQKPAAGMFGVGSGSGFGSGANNTTGMFGSSTNLAGNSSFGANKPATSGGLFGNTTNPTNSNTSTGLFGQQNANTNANPFGQQQSSFGANNMGNGATFGQANRGTFPQQQAQQNTGGLFGTATTGGAFGQQQNASGSLFGAKPASGGLFGQSGSTNTFGMNNNANGATSGGLFGQNNQQSGGGLFGQQQNSNAGGLFGQSNQNQNQSGVFGQQNQPNTFSQPQQQGGLFGSKPTGGLFGQQQGTSTFGSGNNQGNTLFGQNNQQQQPTGGLFGQQNNQSQPQTGGLFGQTNQTNNQSFGQNGSQQPQQNTGLFNTKPAGLGSTGLFSNNTANQNNSLNGGNIQQPSGGLFQNKPQPASGSLFGSKPTNSVGGGLFGNNQTTNLNNTASTTGGLFGNKPNGGSLFSGTNTAAPNTTSGGLFGSNNTSGTAPTSTSTGLFGNKPAGAGAPTLGGGLFGNNNNSSLNNGGNPTGLFGNNNSSQTTNAGGLFQNNASANLPGGGLFSQSSQPMSQSQNMLQPQQQQRLQLQNNNPYGTNELVSKATIVNTVSRPVQPNATKIKADERKKASLTSAYRMVPKTLFTTKLKTNNAVMEKVKIRADPKLSISVDKKNNQITISSHQEETLDESILKASNLLFNPDKRSFKNLINNKKLLSATEKTTEESLNSNISDMNKISEQKISPTKVKVGKRENTNSSSTVFLPSKTHENENAVKDQLRNVDEENKENIAELQKKEFLEDDEQKIDVGVAEKDASFINEDYYISPSMDTLASYSLLQLRKISHLIVGHKKYGKIEFLEPVDLAEIPLTSLGGIVVTFEPKTCIIYANQSNRPKRGEGINARARITCFNCYPADKSTRKPIKDPKHQLVKRHIERLKKNPNSKFESYDAISGTYVFTVSHAAEYAF